MRESEVAAGADAALLEVDAVDGEEVGVEVVEVVEDPQDLAEALGGRVSPRRGVQPPL
ncbi:hypothetical protein OG481_02200 [Streptomyces longwoodensis]|uniref:hypothetical protein n=1 Tax=Streptomyces longwoodensis TaxID=68231 RepID=UPI002DDB0003|nr:hypothetical protein [Streptomyces longwoodensis]WRY87405.1 hypothetical protein OG481_02200 [Streptomyces longwoodensis]